MTDRSFPLLDPMGIVASAMLLCNAPKHEVPFLSPAEQKAGPLVHITCCPAFLFL